jgi:AraC family transcriptional activator of pyochelin receptor
MQPIDFSKLLNERGAETVMPRRAVLTEGIYQCGEGVHFRTAKGNSELIQDIVRLSDGAFLFFSNHVPECDQWHRQIVADSDWLHIQFRLSGGGGERVSEGPIIETAAKSCVISRYPKDSAIERRIDGTSPLRAACLLLTPRGMTDLLEISAADLPEGTSWMTNDGQSEARTRVLPLQPILMLAVNDIVTCSFRGGLRRAYMRAKSLELLSTVLHALGSAEAAVKISRVKLSVSDLGKLSQAASIMTEDLEGTSTLAALARRVGLNRTKLALGFKEIYGTSVQAYWRDVKLSRARELLSNDGALVTEVALSVGYAEVSSFTRAFSRKFGMLPRDCRSASHG